MKAVQAFADGAAATVEELTQQLPAAVREQVANKMAGGCRLCVAVVASTNGSPEVVLELIDCEGARVRLVAVAGQRLQQH